MYTWVNGSDPVWLAAKASVRAAEEAPAARLLWNDDYTPYDDYQKYHHDEYKGHWDDYPDSWAEPVPDPQTRQAMPHPRRRPTRPRPSPDIGTRAS